MKTYMRVLLLVYHNAGPPAALRLHARSRRNTRLGREPDVQASLAALTRDAARRLVCRRSNAGITSPVTYIRRAQANLNRDLFELFSAPIATILA